MKSKDYCHKINQGRILGKFNLPIYHRKSISQRLFTYKKRKQPKLVHKYFWRRSKNRNFLTGMCLFYFERIVICSRLSLLKSPLNNDKIVRTITTYWEEFKVNLILSRDIVLVLPQMKEAYEYNHLSWSDCLERISDDFVKTLCMNPTLAEWKLRWKYIGDSAVPFTFIIEFGEGRNSNGKKLSCSLILI